MRIPSGSSDRYIYFVAVDSTDLKTRETGLSSFTVYRSRNGEAAVAYTTPTVNETDSSNMPGVYELLLDEDTTLDAGDDAQEYCVHITQASMAPVTRTVEIYRPEVEEGKTLDIGADSKSLISTDAQDLSTTLQVDTKAMTYATTLIANILAEVVESEGSITIKQALQILVAVLAGVTTTTGTIFKTPNGNATRVTFTIDTTDNERDTVTLSFA